MSYDIETYGPIADGGVRVSAYGRPTFPPNYTAGTEELKFETDLIADPADGWQTDVEKGWQRGIGIGSTGT